MFESLVAKCRSMIEKYKDINRYIHVAAILKSNNNPLYHGINDYSRTYINRKKVTALHAEANCLNKFKKIKRKFIILRFDKNGNLKDSRPCSECKKLMISKGLTYVYCSMSDGTIKKINLYEVEDYMSLSQKNTIMTRRM